MASTFKIISIVTLILGILSLIAAGVIFVKLRIWEVMADLSGKTAQASIEKLRSQSGQPAPRKRHHSYVVNSSALKRSKGTENLQSEKTEQMGRRWGKKTEPLKNETETVPLAKKPVADYKSNGTVPLEESGEFASAEKGTEILYEGTEILQDGTAVLDSGTMVLENSTIVPQEGTTVLNSGGTTVIGQVADKKAEFNIITDIVMIHTSEKLTLE